MLKWQPNVAEGEHDSWSIAYMQSPAHAASQQPPHRAHATPAFSPNLLLRDFLQERWKGVTPILWGRQLKQERLDELIYLSLMNADHLPADEAGSPLTEFYRYNPMPDDERSD